MVDSARHLGLNDHLCWSYDDRTEFCAAGVEFLRDGLDLGQRVLYVGEGSDDAMCQELAGLGDIDAHRESGALEVRAFADFYTTEPTLFASQADVYALAAEAALVDGHAGLRVVADATSAVLDQQNRAAFSRYEHTVDRLMASGLPLAAMCAYDSSVLGSDAVDELACVHPLAHGAAPPFRLFAVGPDTVAIEGEVDAQCAEVFAAAMQIVVDAHRGAEAGVDCDRLVFIDQRSLVTMDAVARRAGVTLRLTHLRSDAARMTDLLDLRAVRVA
jgi:anti-anti-sigma regulatory factor